MDTKELYQKTLDLWGKELQINMVFEELGELITALSREIRGRNKPIDLAEEIADVEIMLDQLKFIYKMENDVFDLKIGKLARLEVRIRELESKKEVEKIGRNKN